MTKFTKLLKHNARFRVSLPFLSYEVNVKDLIDSSNADERIAKLGEIKRDLGAAVIAVESLQTEATTRKTEADRLSETVERLNEEKTTAEALLKLPEESFTRLLTKKVQKVDGAGFLRVHWLVLLQGLYLALLSGISRRDDI